MISAGAGKIFHQTHEKNFRLPENFPAQSEKKSTTRPAKYFRNIVVPFARYTIVNHCNLTKIDMLVNQMMNRHFARS